MKPAAVNPADASPDFLPSANWHHLRLRAELLTRTRAFFAARGFLEVETTMLQLIPGGAAAKPFVTHHNALDVDMFLLESGCGSGSCGSCGCHA